MRRGMGKRGRLVVGKADGGERAKDDTQHLIAGGVDSEAIDVAQPNMRLTRIKPGPIDHALCGRLLAIGTPAREAARAAGYGDESVRSAGVDRLLKRSRKIWEAHQQQILKWATLTADKPSGNLRADIIRARLLNVVM